MTRAASRRDPRLTPPVDASQRRVGRRRRTMSLLAVTAVVMVLAGGFFGVQRLAGEPGRFVPAVPEPAAAGMVPVTWVSAMVARVATTVTVYSGAGWCKELTDAVAAVAVDGASRVEIAVTARIVEADCSIDGAAVPLAVTLACASMRSSRRRQRLRTRCATTYRARGPLNPA